MNSEHSCQSCEYIPRLHVERQSNSKKKKSLHDINFVKHNISFIALSINLNKGSVILPMMSKSSIAKSLRTTALGYYSRIGYGFMLSCLQEFATLLFCYT